MWFKSYQTMVSFYQRHSSNRCSILSMFGSILFEGRVLCLGTRLKGESLVFAFFLPRFTLCSLFERRSLSPNTPPPRMTNVTPPSFCLPLSCDTSAFVPMGLPPKSLLTPPPPPRPLPSGGGPPHLQPRLDHPGPPPPRLPRPPHPLRLGGGVGEAGGQPSVGAERRGGGGDGGEVREGEGGGLRRNAAHTARWGVKRGGGLKF